MMRKHAKNVRRNNFDTLVFQTNRLRSSLHERTFGATATEILDGAGSSFSYPRPTALNKAEMKKRGMG
jgi:hypothetical protein